MDHGQKSKLDVSDTDNRTAPLSQSGASLPTHKRSLSGSILSRLPFLKTAVEDGSTLSNTTGTAPASTDSSERLITKSSEPSPVDQKKNRKRKGSLRKTALLGTGRMRQDRRGSNVEQHRPIIQSQRRFHGTYETDQNIEETSPISPVNPAEPVAFGFENLNSSTLRDDEYSNNASESSRVLIKGSAQIGPVTNTGDSSVDISTTDEEEGLTFIRSDTNSGLKKPGAGSVDYFPPQNDGAQRRRSKGRPKSPLATLSVEPVGSSDGWDYSETERWGWLVLIVTWIVFVVGMGSCFEVWSWAWDVGETPYAPPELEDDPTLPIVGYYPALIILTTVMAWVWVVIAWVGMKYFRHAKISGEEG